MAIEDESSIVQSKLKKISEVFDIEAILSQSIDQKYINEYYRINKISYDRYQFGTGLVHCGLSESKIFKKEDLLGLTHIIEKYIERYKPRAVLELAMGRGANSVYLARNFSHIDFYGIDTSETQLSYAFSNANILRNFHPQRGDFHDLSGFATARFDLVFVIEALCYSANKDRVLQGVGRVLRPGGLFIVIDGYARQEPNTLSNEEVIAMRLLAKGVAVREFKPYEHLRKRASLQGFEIIEEKDISQKILPFMKWHERRAGWFFRYAHLARLIRKFLPDLFTFNALTGYLGPWLIEHHKYVHMITIFKRI